MPYEIITKIVMLLWCDLFGLIDIGNILSQHSHPYLLVHHAIERYGCSYIYIKIHNQIFYIIKMF